MATSGIVWMDDVTAQPDLETHSCILSINEKYIKIVTSAAKIISIKCKLDSSNSRVHMFLQKGYMKIKVVLRNLGNKLRLISDTRVHCLKTIIAKPFKPDQVLSSKCKKQTEYTFGMKSKVEEGI